MQGIEEDNKCNLISLIIQRLKTIAYKSLKILQRNYEIFATLQHNGVNL